MTLNEVLREMGVDMDRVLFVSLGTDGLKCERDNVMSVSLLSRDKAINRTIFVSGAAAEKTAMYTGVPKSRYDAEKINRLQAGTELRELTKGDWMLVSYQVGKFMRPWAWSHFPDVFKGRTLLDVISVARVLEYDPQSLRPCGSIRELSEELETSISTAGKIPTYSLPALYTKFGGQPTGMSELESKTHQTSWIFENLLLS
jgi:hypothetical protein